MNRRDWPDSRRSLLLGGYLSSGLTVLQPDEVGVVRRLGPCCASRGSRACTGDCPGESTGSTGSR